MKTRIESPVRSASDSRNARISAEAADFHSGRINRELKIRSRRKYANKPAGNYEYEQMIAEDANFNNKLISEAAYFIAERRGFVTGKELSDWLQAEKQIEGLLRATLVERRKAPMKDRRGGTSLKA